MSEPVRFAEPVPVSDPTQCFFYHRMQLPGVGEVGGGQWDLREVIDDYLGGYDFSGKDALDVGAASGFLTFEMERRGARVVSFDMDDAARWDFVPQKVFRQNPERRITNARAQLQKLKNAYWFAHAHLDSKAKAYDSDIYHLPAGLGEFDVAVMGMVVGHLRDPFQGIYSVSQRCRSHLIITNQSRQSDSPKAIFMPSVENQETMAWWGLSEACLRQMLRIVGFEVTGVLRSQPRCLVKGREGVEDCMSLVAQRVA